MLEASVLRLCWKLLVFVSLAADIFPAHSRAQANVHRHVHLDPCSQELYQFGYGRKLVTDYILITLDLDLQNRRPKSQRTEMFNIAN